MNRFSSMDTETLLKYRTACERVLVYSHLPSIEAALKLIIEELKNREFGIL